MAEEHQEHGGGGLSRKVGPLPMWAWAVAVGGLGGLVWFWRRGKSGAADTAAADSAAAGGAETSPTSLVPISEGLADTQYQGILDAIKKLQGPDSDDDDDDDDDKPKPKPWPPNVPGLPKPKPRPKTVTVVKWHPSPHTPWNSTLWGIANHEHVAGGWKYLQKINHLHGDPKKALQPGMKIKLGA